VEQGFDTVAVIAGDGTIHEAVNGLIGTGVKLAVIPGGRGNDLARNIGLASDPVAAATVLKTGTVAHIDLGRVNGEYFFNVAGVGFDAEVAAAVNNGRVYVNGMVTYVVYVLKLLASYRPVDAHITLDDRSWSQPLFLAAAGNGKYLGGGMKLAPQADIHDGEFDVVLAGDLSRREALRALTRIYSGTHISLPKVDVFRGRVLTIDADYPLNVEADGEIVGRVPVTFTVAPAALPVIVPTGGEGRGRVV